MALRPYQREAHDEIMSWVRKSTEPACAELATGAGKSHIVASVAAEINAISRGKHVLCLAPSAELVMQNAEKYKSTGAKASMFSASVGEKSLKHPVVFGTPGTVKNKIDRFDGRFAAVIIDEAHGITPTITYIVDMMRKRNPNLRVIGLSATPYRMNTGYIFGMWPDGKPVSDRETKNPYFAKCLYRIRANQLIDMKFLTKPIVGEIGSEHYDTINMKINKLGQFERDDVDRAYNGHGRKTSSIIEDIVRQSCNRKGVMIFAATVQHADECMASLPRELSAIVTSETKKTDRDYILKMFKRRKIKYLVNVAVLTTGFDAEHVDVIAILRATESVGLLQQIIGRGLRLCDGKDDCLILDYAENIERHCPDGDIFAPEISVRGSDKENGETECKCPICDVTNVFSSRPNPDKYDVSEDGYFVDLDGNKIETDWGYMPSHFGRRCRGKTLYRGELIQCDYRWTSKPCPKCMEENDIAARYCCKCKSEIVDPNEKLKIEFKQLKRDPTQMQTDVVTGWVVSDSLSKKGKDMHKVEVKTPFRSFTVWVMKVPTFPRAWSDLRMLQSLNGEAPKTVTYRKDSETGFYQIFAYNEEADEIPERS